MNTAILVVSIETTCWEEGAKPPDQESEIIEVGMCLLELDTGRRSKKRSFKIRPINSVISSYCMLRTGTTPNEMKRAIDFKDVCYILEEDFASRTRIWASYGDPVEGIFRSQCANQGIAYPFTENHLNVEKLVAEHFNLSSPSWKQIRESLGMPLEFYYRNSGNSAWEVAGLLKKLLCYHEL